MSTHTLTSGSAIVALDAAPKPTSAANPLADLDTLVAAHQQRIFRFLLLSLRDRDLAQSLTQDTFLRAWTTRDSFRGECTISTWLLRIALNLLRDHTRTERFRFWKRAATTAIDATDLANHLPHPTTSADSQLIARQQLTHIWQIVSTLSARQRSVFLLRFVEDLNLTEIAASTGMPISTVKSHLYRALAAIRASQHGSSEASL